MIGVSTKHKQYKLPYIQLPFAPDGHRITRLKKDCGAIVGWYDRLAIPDDVTGSSGGFGGDVPPAIMSQIDESVRKDLVQLVGRQFTTVQKMLEELLDQKE